MEARARSKRTGKVESKGGQQKTWNQAELETNMPGY